HKDVPVAGAGELIGAAAEIIRPSEIPGHHHVAATINRHTLRQHRASASQRLHPLIDAISRVLSYKSIGPGSDEIGACAKIYSLLEVPNNGNIGATHGN